MERYYGGGTIPWIKSGELRESVINSAEEHVTDAALKESSIKMVPSGAILLAMYGATVGRLGILGIEATTNQAVCHIIPDPNIAVTRYVYHALSSQVPSLISMGVGGAQPNINQGIIKSLAIPLPTKPEQRRIVAILDQADALRAKRREALAQLDSLTQSIFIEMFGDPDKNEKSLPVESLSTLCKRITDGTHLSPKWETSGIPFLFISNIVDGQITFDTQKFISAETYTELTRRCPIELGDVLYTTVGSYGNAAVVETTRQFAFQRHIAHIKPDMTKANPLFVAAMIQSTGVRRQVDKVAKGVAQKTVNLADLKNLLVFAPALDLQQTFATRIQSIEALKVTHNAALQELDRLFASLQHRAFQGEL
jgi:type I restriction enzyme S subunit